MRRRNIIIVGTLAGTVLGLALLPWWLAPVLRGVGRHYRSSFSRYERIGYGRFAIHDVIVNAPGVQVRVDRAETVTPVAWLFDRWTGHPAEITTGGWRVDVAPRPDAPKSATPGGALHTRAILFKVAGGLERWAPHARVGQGEVTWPGGGLKVGGAQWNQRTLAASAVNYAGFTGRVDATFTSDGKIQAAAHPAGTAPWVISLTSAGDTITGWIELWDQRATVEAHLAEQRWMPDTIRVVAEHWSVAAANLGVGEIYSSVAGDFRVEWSGERFVARMNATGAAVGEKRAPPLIIAVQASGDREGFQVDSLAAEFPGLTARLSAPVAASFHGDIRSGPSQFEISADLSKQPWFAGARGRVTGRAEIVAGNSAPLVTAEISAQDLAFGDWAVANASGQAKLTWPRLDVTGLVLRSADGDTATIAGGYDFARREVIEATVKGKIRAPLVARWLPAAISFGRLAIDARARGPIGQLQHDGHAEVEQLAVRGIKPLTVEAIWHGDGAKVEVPSATIRSGESRIVLAGRLDGSSATLASLSFAVDGAERLKLAQPVAVKWSAPLQVGKVELAGDEASLALTVDGRAKGNFQGRVRNFSSGWLRDIVPEMAEPWKLASLDAAGEWADGPVTFSVQGELAVTVAPGRIAGVTLAAKGGPDGVDVGSLRVAEGAAEIASVSGHLPLTLRLAPKSQFKFDPEAPLTVKVATASNPAFWKTLSDSLGVDFQDPQLTAALRGSWAHPRGEITAQAARLAVDPKRIRLPWPKLEGLEARLVADRGELVLEHFSAKVEGQEVRVSGRLPLELDRWSELKESPFDYLRRQGSWRLEVPDADLAALARFAPTLLAPTGKLQIDATFKSGGAMSGSLRVRGATTLPLGPLGVLQGVRADVELNGRKLEVHDVAAQAGGQPVTLAGAVEFPETGPPEFDLTLKGENLPLVRQMGLLVRADLDLKLATGRDHVTAVTGAVKLRDSVFLSDIRAFLPRGGGSDPLGRPPFFSFELPPFNQWRLGVDVRGEKFLRLRSAVFTGMASARFRLTGTLAEPRAIGEATADSGLVLLPFASFRVDQANVRLTEADPYALRIFLAGTARRYGYDLRMEITGTAADPIVTFSSSPPLEARQVLLMVTAGEVPNDEITYSTNQRAARLGAYLGQSLINNFGGDATEADRLSISSGERVSRQGRETYDIEYHLTDRLSLVGEYDEFDDYNAGAKWLLTKPRAPLPKPATGSKPVDPKPKSTSDDPSH